MSITMRRTGFPRISSPTASFGHHTDMVSGPMFLKEPYSSRYSSEYELPQTGFPLRGAPPETVHQLLKDELDLDGKPNLNLASFVGTYMEPQAEQLVFENLSKNMSDVDEYPAMVAMHNRCVSIIANLWHAQVDETPVGSATTGSSEAIHLGGLAMKRRWQEKRHAEGKDASRPNIIMGSNAQIALLKFAKYFDVEARVLPVSEKSRYRLDPHLIRNHLDENTIGVFAIMGSTYTGHYELIEEISNVLDEFQRESGLDIPIHVDAASGGFVAPFTIARAGGCSKWDFELPRVKSINTSGHKFGLVYAGLGWIIWRDEKYLPKHLVFELNYLGAPQKTYTLSFSRPGAHIIAQYYNIVRLGFAGYRTIMENCLANARLLSQNLEKTGWYTCVSDIHRKPAWSLQFPAHLGAESANPKETSADYNAGLPVVAFRFSDKFKARYPKIQQYALSTLLKARQYIVPNYPLPPSVDHLEILRIVVRESMSLTLLNQLFSDICAVTQNLVQAEYLEQYAHSTCGPATQAIGIETKDSYQSSNGMIDSENLEEWDEVGHDSAPTKLGRGMKC